MKEKKFIMKWIKTKTAIFWLYHFEWPETNVERLVDLCRKTDDFHLSDFREMRHLKRRLLHCIFCSNGHQLGCLFEILWQTNHISDTLRYFIALIRSSNTLREHDNVSPDHSSCSFPMKFGKNFQKLYS